MLADVAVEKCQRKKGSSIVILNIFQEKWYNIVFERRSIHFSNNILKKQDYILLGLSTIRFKKDCVP